MPTTYAHYRFGREALPLLPEEIQEMVRNNLELFHFGVHGPDLLFYFKPLSKNVVNQVGYASHLRTGLSFFTQGAKAVMASPQYEASLSYLLGVLCHFALDRESHPYVAEKEKTGASHSEIEASFDRYLMKKDGLDPLHYKPTGHLVPSRGSSLVIAEFYPPLTGKQVHDAEKAMVFYLNALAVSPGIKRSAMLTGMKAAGKGHLGDMLIPAGQNLKCRDSDEILFQKYQGALPLYETMAAELLQHLEDGSPLGLGFEHTFGEN